MFPSEPPDVGGCIASFIAFLAFSYLYYISGLSAGLSVQPPSGRLKTGLSFHGKSHSLINERRLC